MHFSARPGATITGRVLTPHGTPAAGVSVAISSTENIRSGTDGLVKTAADGSYRIGGLATDSYTIQAYDGKTISAAGKAWIAKPLTDITLTEGKVTTAPALHAQLGAGLEGTVVDAETGRPIPGVSILGLFDSDLNFGPDIVTDTHGHFSCRTLPGQMSLLVGFPPYGYVRQKIEEAVPVALQEGQTVTVTLELHKGLIVTGTVVDAKNKPAAELDGAIIIPGTEHWDDATVERDSMHNIIVEFTCDEHGHFEVAGVPAGKGLLAIRPTEQSQPDDITRLRIEVPAKAPIIIKLKEKRPKPRRRRRCPSRPRIMRRQRRRCREPYRNRTRARSRASPARRRDGHVPRREYRARAKAYKSWRQSPARMAVATAWRRFPSMPNSVCSRWTRRAIDSASRAR